MCGIYGLVRKDLFLNKDIISKVDLNHRGPDHFGYYCTNFENNFELLDNNLDNKVNDSLSSFLMLHFRLSIIDTSESSNQPMTSYNSRYVICFNGEIYNYKSIQSDLKKRGHQFSTNSDTEVILNSFLEWGENCLNKFVGMFAFAIFDKLEKKIFLARDPFGIKPLFYKVNNNSFCFSSEISPILKTTSFSHQADYQTLYNFLFYDYLDGTNKTFFDEIKKLLPGHFAWFDLKKHKLQIKSYEIFDNIKNIDLSFSQAKKQLKELFLESVDLHMTSDVEISAALSGGIDSSAIVSCMRYLQPDKKIHVFSFISSDPKKSEEKWIDIVKKEKNLQCHKIFPESDDLKFDLDFFIKAQEQPISGTSIYAQHKVFQKINQLGIKVVLDGQGADEVLGGYPAFMSPYLTSMMLNKSFITFFNYLGSIHKNKPLSYLSIIKLISKSLLPTNLSYLIKKNFIYKYQNKLVNFDVFKEKGVKFNSFENMKKKILNKNIFRNESILNLKYISIPSLLRYADMNSMKYSVESRVPFLNVKLIKFILGLPAEYIIDKNGTTKKIFREAMRGIVPDQILDRKDKIGFETPEKNWINSNKEYFSQMLAQSKTNNLINHDQLLSALDKISKDEINYNPFYWRLINIQRWSDLFNIKI